MLSVKSIIRSGGQANADLHYFDGVLKLTYLNGDRYHSDPPVLRSTEIIFLCDATAGRGQPRFESEMDRTYRIVWNTIFACPNKMSICSTTNEATGEHYDLSG